MIVRASAALTLIDSTLTCLPVAAMDSLFSTNRGLSRCPEPTKNRTGIVEMKISAIPKMLVGTF
jgi:hypothetical protein